jgi:HEAT repeat protein
MRHCARAWLLLAAIWALACVSRGAEVPATLRPDFAAFDDPDRVLILSQFTEKLAGAAAEVRAEALAALRARLDSPAVEVRRRAALALHSLGDETGVPVMIRDMKRATQPTDRNNLVVARWKAWWATESQARGGSPARPVTEGR